MGFLRDLEKLLDKVNQDIERNKRNAHYKEIGYSTRCKTCNHPLVKDIERLYNNGYSYEHIIEELNLETIGGLEGLKDIDHVELVVAVDPKNQEIYRETITGDQAKTLLEKVEIARELVELKRENSWQFKYENYILTILILICISCFVIAILYGFGVI